MGFMFLLIIFSFKTNAISKAIQSENNKVDIVISSIATKQETKAANELTSCLKEIYPSCRFSVTTVINENNQTVRMGLPGFLSLDESITREIP